LKAFGREDHLRIYGRDYGERLRGGNLELKSISPLEFTSTEEMHSFGLENEKLLFARAISGVE
jgi:hypothetical protein